MKLLPQHNAERHFHKKLSRVVYNGALLTNHRMHKPNGNKRPGRCLAKGRKSVADIFFPYYTTSERQTLYLAKNSPEITKGLQSVNDDLKIVEDVVFASRRRILGVLLSKNNRIPFVLTSDW